jgi:hypothetical protein
MKTHRQEIWNGGYKNIEESSLNIKEIILEASGENIGYGDYLPTFRSVALYSWTKQFKNRSAGRFHVVNW